MDEVEMRKAMMRERKAMTLFRQPTRTLYHFSYVAAETVVIAPFRWASNPTNLKQVAPLAILATLVMVAHFTPGKHQELLKVLEHQFWYLSWWFGLGVASSIGLGTGAHTGTLFLFPHICAVVRTAEKRGALDFDHTTDMWSLPYPQLAKSFVIPPAREAAGPAPGFYELLTTVMLPVIVWGAGTALGELPPYLVSYSAAKAGAKDEEYEELMGSLEEEDTHSWWDVIKNMERWMVRFLEHNGFWGVLLMASYPNAMFDMCGLCCGHFMMNMWSFLIATIIGKGFIKAPLQAVAFTYIFSSGGREGFLELCKEVLSYFQWYIGIPLTILCGFAAHTLRKKDNYILMPVVLMVVTLIVFAATVGEEFQEVFDVTGKMKTGLNKVLSFCDPPEDIAARAQKQASSAAGLNDYFGPKAVFSYIVTSLILYFVQDVMTKFAQHRLGEQQRVELEKLFKIKKA